MGPERPFTNRSQRQVTRRNLKRRSVAVTNEKFVFKLPIVGLSDPDDGKYLTSVYCPDRLNGRTARKPLLRAPTAPGTFDLLHLTTKDRLMKGLYGFLARDRDRKLFDLPPKPDSSPKTASERS